MSPLTEWQSAFARLLGCETLGGVAVPGPQTRRIRETSGIADDYLTHLVPNQPSRVGPFVFLDLDGIEENLAGLIYSAELQELHFLPIGEFENDKLVCIDCEFPGFVILQLGMGTIQPIRKFLLHRFTQFPDLLGFVASMSSSR